MGQEKGRNWVKGSKEEDQRIDRKLVGELEEEDQRIDRR